MKYKGFEIKEVIVKGTRWFVAFTSDGRQLVDYTEVMGQRTGATVPFLFVSESIAKQTIDYLLQTGTLENHI